MNKFIENIKKKLNFELNYKNIAIIAATSGLFVYVGYKIYQKKKQVLTDSQIVVQDQNQQSEIELPLYKCVLIGETQVGKSTIMNSIQKKPTKSGQLSTIGVEFNQIYFNSLNSPCILQLWDTGGQQRYRSIIKCHIKNKTGALIVYDITRLTTFNQLDDWLQAVKQDADPNCKIILVGTKLDLVKNNSNNRQISQEDAQSYATKNNMLFYEIDANDFNQVQKVFENLVAKIRSN